MQIETQIETKDDGLVIPRCEAIFCSHAPLDLESMVVQSPLPFFWRAIVPRSVRRQLVE
jgi:hypothetical protein